MGSPQTRGLDSCLDAAMVFTASSSSGCRILSTDLLGGVVDVWVVVGVGDDDGDVGGVECDAGSVTNFSLQLDNF